MNNPHAELMLATFLGAAALVASFALLAFAVQGLSCGLGALL